MSQKYCETFAACSKRPTLLQMNCNPNLPFYNKVIFEQFSYFTILLSLYAAFDLYSYS